MVPRVRFVAGVLAIGLLWPLMAAAATTTIRRGTQAYDNVQTAIDFLREHGSADAAAEIQKRLDAGEISINDGLDMNVNGETSNITGSIELNPDVALPTVRLNLDRWFTQVVELARTLYHENIHSNHQGYFFSLFLGSDAQEHYAYSYTILELQKWIRAEWDQYFDVLFRPLTPMTAVDHSRQLDRLKRKISVLKKYNEIYKINNYFGYDDKTWVERTDEYWQRLEHDYIDPEMKKLEPQIAPQPDPVPPAVGGTPATPTTPQPKTEPKAEPPQPETPPEPPPPPPCDPCRKIADQIRDVKERLKTLNENAQKADDAVLKNQQHIGDLQKRVANLQAALASAAGTGGSSYDPATGQTVEAYDQGNGTVKVTTKDAAGNVIDEHVRDSSARKADLNRQINEANADIAKAQAEGKRLETAAATAHKLVNDMATLLDQLVKELEDCIKKYCGNLTTSEVLNILQLPYESLDVLRDPTSYNPFDGNTNDAFQVMIIEIRVGNAPGMTVPRGSTAPARGFLEDFRQPRTMLAALLSWLRPKTGAWLTRAGRWSDEPRRPWAIEADQQARSQQSPFKKPIQMLLTSLGQSTGQAFDLQVFNGSGNPFRLAPQSLVVQPLKDEARRQVQSGMQRLIGATASPITAKINGYCLEFLKAPPTAGTIFKIASPELQRRFEPMRKIMDASRRVQQQLRPDSNPEGYFNSIRQWAMWSVEQKLNEKTFGNAFLEHTKKLVTGQKQPWSKDAEETIKKVTPNRWSDIQRVLAAAGVPVPR
jgi:hypothetical protein